MAASWAAWREFVAEQELKAQALGRALQRFRHSCLSAAWTAWREHLALTGIKKSQAAKALMMFQNQHTTRAWNAWRACVEDVRTHRHVLATTICPKGLFTRTRPWT